MTREEAIYQIKQLAVLSTDKEIPKITEALELAIEALQAEPTHGRLIDADALLEELKKTYKYMELKEYINSAPTVQADRPHGEWVDWLGSGNEWECSVCKCSIESHGSIAYKFCPMCGADMRGEKE